MSASAFRSVLLLSVALLIAGCSSSGGQIGEGKKATESFTATKKALDKAQQQVDQTLASMKGLNGTDLRKTYPTFTKEVDELEKMGKAAAKRSEAMRSNMQAYVKKWQEDMSEMTDPTIKASLQERQTAVSANFEKVRTAAHAARDAYTPLMARLQEISKALAIDLSPAALPGLKPAMDNANAQGHTLKEKLSAMQKELDGMLSGMSGTAPK
jgi:chromosome segregation ATPase